MDSHEGSHDAAYTMQAALKDAAELLNKQFGEADQDAAVALATFLFHAHERDEFMRRAGGEGFDEFMSPVV